MAMQWKRITVVIILYGFVLFYPVINGLSIQAYIASLISGFITPILGSGFASFAPVITGGLSLLVLFYAFDKVKVTQSYSVKV